MITPSQIKQKANKLWNSGRVLQSALTHEPLFPWFITFRKPNAKQQIEDFVAVREWVSQLRAHCKAASDDAGGYTIEYKTINHRQLGTQQLPVKIVFVSQEDLLRYLGKLRQFDALITEARQTEARFALLNDWLLSKTARFMQYFPIWSELLLVCEYFILNPQPNCYLRELEIKGIDTKFIEKNTKILSELLDLLLPAEAINQQVTGLKQHGFERRYGLKYDLALIRLRLLDERLYPLVALSDLSLPVSQLAQWEIPCQRVFITENKINGLSFPQMDKAVVIFGLGYGVEQLAEIPWLSACEIIYWGDIDTHGFSILSRLRAYFPQARSLMMDEATLLTYKAFCVVEPKNARCQHQLEHLTSAEQKLYQQLQHTQQRLEQERLPMSYIKQSLGISI